MVRLFLLVRLSSYPAASMIPVVSILASLICSALALKSANTVEPWVGSALGTLEYRSEVAAIELGKSDYVEALDHATEYPPKPLLCVSFLGLSPYSCMSLQGNIDHMDDKCDWAIVMYAGNEVEVAAICKTANVSSNVVFCGRSRESLLAEKLQKSIPKSVQYQTLLSKFMKTWDCSFEKRPLIVQPLIAESNQYLSYVNLKSWANDSRADVIASTVGYVEQQVPAFDSIFFTWFV